MSVDLTTKKTDLLISLLVEAEQGRKEVTLEILTGVEAQPVVSFSRCTVISYNDGIVKFKFNTPVDQGHIATIVTAVVLEQLNRALIIDEVLSAGSNLTVAPPNMRVPRG